MTVRVAEKKQPANIRMRLIRAIVFVTLRTIYYGDSFSERCD